MKSLALFLFISGLGMQGWCGYEVGNGGHGIVCGSQVKLLDVIEDNGIRLTFPEVADPFLRAHAILESWRSIDSARIDKWENDLEDVRKNAIWTKPGEVLLTISDQGPTVLPVGCEVRQAAIQARDPITDSYAYHFDSNLWAQFDNDSKTALLVHEVVYKDLLDVLPTAQSYLIRPFVRYIISTNTSTVSIEAYVRVLKNIGFPFYVFKGWHIHLHSPYEIKNQQVIKAEVTAKWPSEERWQWIYDSEKNIRQLLSLSDDFSTPFAEHLGRFTLLGTASYLQYQNDKIVGISSSVQPKLFNVYDDDGNLVAEVKPSVIQSYVAVVKDSAMTLNINTKSPVECGEILTTALSAMTCQSGRFAGAAQYLMLTLNF